MVDNATIEILRRGGLVIYPTETIYGLGCVASNGAAVQRLFEVKGRDAGKPPPLLIHDLAQLDMLCLQIPDVACRLMQRYWPGALTLVLRAQPGLPQMVTGLNESGLTTVAVRLTAHPVARELCENIGAPLVATSANFAGATGVAAAPHTLQEVDEELLQRVDVALDGGEVGGKASTIVDCSDGAPRVLRVGALLINL